MIKANNKIICYLKEDQSEFLEERRQKDLVNEFAALTTSESVSWYTGYKHNDVCPTVCGNQSLVDAVDCTTAVTNRRKCWSGRALTLKIRDVVSTFFVSFNRVVQCTIDYTGHALHAQCLLLVILFVHPDRAYLLHGSRH